MSGPRSEKPEEDVQADPHVAGSREDGSVGRTSSDEDFDTEETGAEKRAK
jgi:hypothetical protein